MTFFELFLIGIGLSMDAFAVSICKGLSMQKIDKKYTLCIGLFFGGFAAFRLPAATNRRLRSAGGDSFRLAAVSLPGRQTIYAFVNSAASPRMVKARRSLNTNALILEILPFGSERPVPKVTVFPMSGSA